MPEFGPIKRQNLIRYLKQLGEILVGWASCPPSQPSEAIVQVI